MVFTRNAQTIVEYAILVSLVMVALYYMGTGIKRGVQSLVKVTADQVGSQQNADQDFTNPQTGFMLASNTQMGATTGDWNAETGYINGSGVTHFMATTGYSEASVTMTNTITNGGFSPQ
ncbi:MAG: hypothetical protein KGJ09_05470 [Candidatus Omnitrophica bacterium]|nr:hypothetical protein [Candidatus Omnitrophota bacterium]MDE2009513.1 hypothetical protein [Candidatus Omnitrophota bacterium]MDE2214557.1 hypothetical protein [Candidatus Omnitrophota bacterium]MDE2231634.1 hypothetical protein [Candidatus Omnitrophota bacterium]